MYVRSMKRLLVAWLAAIILVQLGFPSLSFSQTSLPTLAEIKIAAEKGDAEAQNKLGDAYLGRLNFSSAAEWFEKAANQGIVDSQWRLGQILLNGRPKVAEGSIAVPANKTEGIRWLLIAANQGLGSAQLDIGNCYETGNGVKQDYIEAYKWYKLGTAHNSTSAKIYLDRVILKLSSQQIEEGQKRAGIFVPNKTRIEPPTLLDKIVLRGIAGPANHRLAIINNVTFETGESKEVKIDQRVVNVRCIEIRDKSVLVRVEGLEGDKEILLKQ
jgi:TPR repeat protein